MTGPNGDIASRKADHLDLCIDGDVGFQSKTTLFEQVELVHDALPELSLDEIDTRVKILGKELKAPLFIAAMTGGTERARAINRELAKIADERGYGFGLGSQRPMLKAKARGELDATFLVRDVAPNVLLLGNLGGVQARELSSNAVQDLVREVGADALCVHLNPAMEIVQPGGDRDFRGILATIQRLTEELDVPVIAKETGCGIGPGTARALAKAAIRHVDVSGSGGTSWVAVETARATDERKELGRALRDWGVPTAASVAIVAAARPRFRTIIATGGVSRGLEVAKAVALGASAAGIARPVLQAFAAGGREGAIAFLAEVEAELRAVMLLTGSRTVEDLRGAPKLLRGDLERWASLAR